MRRRALAIALASASLLAAAACVDLFHSTDVQSLCDVDANAPGCASDGGDGGAVDLCAPDTPTAEAWAERACAWLAACEDPIGQNVTGECMVNALMAYNCGANPNRRPLGAARDFWLCMQNAQNAPSCAAVAACVFPNKTPACKSGGFIGCSQTPNANVDTRTECNAAGPAHGENCVAYGQTCDSLDRDASNDNALCVGAAGRACTQSKCTGTDLSLCDDAGVDRGYDCALLGGGGCLSTGVVPACRPGGDAGLCLSSGAISCTAGGVAQGCASGYKESVDCNAISGPSSCAPLVDGGAGITPLAACQATGGCTGDTCAVDKLVACVRGRIATIDCTGLGLKPCSNAIATIEGNRSACTPP
ncbi:MAG TPA: hypothetical protein VLM85_23275 [Polyangiaceae bacterium]|nr:hypothetical protein [Polyangiaceae bacterium]